MSKSEVHQWIEENVIEIDGRYYEAKYDDKANQWYGPLRDDISKKSGCSGWFARSKAGISGAGGRSWSARSSVIRWATKAFLEGKIWNWSSVK